jgi:putative PIN family toxin of toxin-antitoxin system
LIVKPERLVIDANVLVSAVVFRAAVPWKAVIRAFETGVVLSSSATRNELREVMKRSKFDRYAPVQLRMDAIEDIFEDMEPVNIVENIAICRDPKDDKILELAINGKARVVITGDKDLLTLHPFRGVAVLTPADYLAR